MSIFINSTSAHVSRVYLNKSKQGRVYHNTNLVFTEIQGWESKVVISRDIPSGTAGIGVEGLGTSLYMLYVWGDGTYNGAPNPMTYGKNTGVFSGESEAFGPDSSIKVSYRIRGVTGGIQIGYRTYHDGAWQKDVWSSTLAYNLNSGFEKVTRTTAFDSTFAGACSILGTGFGLILEFKARTGETSTSPEIKMI